MLWGVAGAIGSWQIKKTEISFRIPHISYASEAMARIFRFLTMSCLLIGVFMFFTSPVFAAKEFNKQVLIGADFHDADLRATTFSLTNLREANFKGANLEGGSLFGAKLHDADLSYTNLRGATLDSAVFDGTNLDQAILEDAFAFNTKFKNVSIIGADFTNVPLRGDSLKTLCAVASGVNNSTGRNTFDTLECP